MISKLSISSIRFGKYTNICSPKKVLPNVIKEEHRTNTKLAKEEKRLQRIEYAMRFIANRFMDLFATKKQKEFAKNVSKIQPEANESYLFQSEMISRIFSTDKVIDINIEDKILEKIAQSQGSHIFIMNHSNQRQDPSMLAVISTLLSKAYKDEGRQKNFPLPKIILNQDILKTMNSTKRKAFKACGAVGIDANVFCADKKANANAFLPIIKDFVRDKINVFIFPEGKLSILQDFELDLRFQEGIAELINKALKIKKEIKVIPLGFAYGPRGTKLTGIQIGKPVVFKRDGDRTTTTSGYILNSEFGKEAYKNFFKLHKNEKDVLITENGIPVKPNEVTSFIKGILSENLDICSKEAQKRIEKSSSDDFIKI